MAVIPFNGGPMKTALHHHAYMSLVILSFACLPASIQAGNTWDGGGADDNWTTLANWSGDLLPIYGTLVFSGNTRTNNNNNSAIASMNQVNWNGTAAWTMTGTGTLSLFDIGGTQAKLESLGSGGVTINAPIIFAALNILPSNPFGEINAVGSDMTFSGSTLTVNGVSVNGIKLFGGSHVVNFNNTVNAAGKWFGITTSGTGNTINVGGAFTSGDFYVMNDGTLNLTNGGTLNASAIRLGGDFGTTGNQNQTKGGTFGLTAVTGGLAFSGTINAVSGNTSGALIINSANTSGSNTLSGSIFLDIGLRVTNAAGGILALTGTTDVKAQQIIVGPSGTITVGGQMASSLAAGGTLLLNGPGTLNLNATNNNYTGTNVNSLNASGTQIANNGTLNIAGDGSLGLAPAGSYNNIQFTGPGTLRPANSISLAATRNISVASGATATFDPGTNTLTVNGVINGSGGLVKTGNGTLVLNSNNTYSGTTTVSQGTLMVLGATASGSTVSISSGATLAGTGGVGGSLTVNPGAFLSPGNGGIGVLTNSGVPTLLGTVRLEVNRSSSPNADKFVRSGGSLTYGGTLTVTNRGAAPVNGDTFTLFNASSFGGVFTTLNLPTGGVLHWRTNNLVVDGSIAFSNRSPVAVNLTLGVAAGSSNSLLVIGGKHTPTDADGDTVTITAVTQGANGIVTFTGTNLTYTSTNGAPSDSFSYTVGDGVGGADTKTVTVSIVNPEGFNSLSAPNVISPGTVTLSYAGIPGTAYALDWATNLTPTINWTGLFTNTAPANGLLRFTNTSAAAQNYFRTRYVGP